MRFPGTTLAIAACLFASAGSGAQPTVRGLTGIIEGHDVGGIAIDWIGNIYTADFGDEVWRITPEGQRQDFASGLYGTSGNAIDRRGHLLQSNFYGDSIVRVDRNGVVRLFAAEGLERPVGLAIHRQTNDVYVANCGSNSIARITMDGNVSSFATSPLFNCPYGIAFDRQGMLYAVNFRDNRMLKVDPNGAVTQFATVSEGGLGYLCFKSDRFYVTAFRSHALYEVALDGNVRRVLGNGERGLIDGIGEQARLSFPAGIACHPWAPRLYINEDVNEGRLPRRSIVREVTLDEGR